MELDDLKQVWQEQPAGADTGSEALQKLMLGKSKGPIARIRRNLNRELGVVLATYVLAISFYVFVDKSRYWNVAILLVVILVGFFIYYFKKKRLLNEMENVSREVKVNLEQKVKLLSQYVRFYFISGTIGAPLAFLVAYFMVQSRMPKGILYSQFFGWPLWVGLTILTVLSYFLNKWYVNKLYGKHVEKLRELISQLAD